MKRINLLICIFLNYLSYGQELNSYGLKISGFYSTILYNSTKENQLPGSFEEFKNYTSNFNTGSIFQNEFSDQHKLEFGDNLRNDKLNIGIELKHKSSFLNKFLTYKIGILTDFYRNKILSYQSETNTPYYEFIKTEFDSITNQNMSYVAERRNRYEFSTYAEKYQLDLACYGTILPKKLISLNLGLGLTIGGLFNTKTFLFKKTEIGTKNTEIYNLDHKPSMSSSVYFPFGVNVRFSNNIPFLRNINFYYEGRYSIEQTNLSYLGNKHSKYYYNGIGLKYSLNNVDIKRYFNVFDDTTEVKHKFKLKEISQLFYINIYSYNQTNQLLGSLSEFKSVAKNFNFSALTENYRTLSVVTDNIYFNTSIGLIKKNSKENKFRKNIIYRLGIDYRNSINLINSIDNGFYETKHYLNSKSYIDTVVHDFYNLKNESKKATIDLSTLIQLFPNSIITPYIGGGLNIGISFENKTSIEHQVDTIYYTPTNHFHGNNNENSEYVERNKNSLFYGFYIPIGINLNLSRKINVLKNISFFYEERNYIQFLKMEGLSRKTNFNMMHGIGLKIRI